MNFPLVCEYLCLALSVVFFWSTFLVLAGLIKPERKHPRATRKLRFAVIICARNEERVIRLPIKSIQLNDYPSACRQVIVLADNCTDCTAEVARSAGAEVWEKSEPSAGKGDVLAWGLKRVVAENRFDAVAVFDADNMASSGWLAAMNDALQDGESVVTGRRQASNARQGVIPGWYAVYWDLMNELSNRVRTNLGLSGKLTGTGFAFLLSVLGERGWCTHTMVEDVEFTVQTNLAGSRIAYAPEAFYADEQPVTMRHMWCQLKRWATGGWQVVVGYIGAWLKTLFRHPSLRLFDAFFAILTGMSMAFVLLFDSLAFIVRLYWNVADEEAVHVFLGVIGFVFLMSWVTAWAAVALSSQKRRPKVLAIALFPFFSLILSAAVLVTLVFPTRRWKPIPHSGRQ